MISYLQDILDHFAAAQGDPVITLFGQETVEYTGSDMIGIVGSVATQIDYHSRTGDRILISLPTGIAQVTAILATLIKGRTAVVAPVANTLRQADHQRRIAEDAGCQFAFASAAVADLPWETPRLDRDAALTPEDTALAVLQYTSGSTGAPNGVRLAHTQIEANLRGIAQRFDQQPGDPVVGWMPLFHDMGLFGTLLHPLRNRQPVHLTSPEHFLRRPHHLLQEISRAQATTCGGPNFAFGWMADRVDPSLLDGVDLSCWRVAFCGAEPISVKTLDRFAQTFAPLGFDARAFLPCYGQAETVLFAAAAVPGHGVIIDQGRVASGRPHEELVIAAASGSALLPDGEVGEICLRGPSLTDGYHGQNNAGLKVTLLGRGPGWFRTGDLGYLRDGLLYVTGRAKDLIVVRGQNVHPSDIENAVAAEMMGTTCCAIPINADDSEGIGLLLETRQAPGQAIAMARAAVRAELGIEPALVALVKGRSLLRTTSGKLQRGRCASAWRDGTLAVSEVWFGSDNVVPLRTGTETALAAIWEELLGEAVRSSADNFFALGGASLLALELSSRIREAWSKDVGIEALLRAPDLAAQAALIDAASPVVRSPATEAPEEPEASPLTLQQKGLQTLERLRPGAQPPISITLALPKGAEIEPALAALVARHPVLSAGLSEDGKSMVRRPWCLTFGLPSLAEGCPMTVDVQRAKVTLRFDHQIADGQSLVTILRDLDALLSGALLPPPPPSGFAFARMQAAAVRQGRFASELERHKERWGNGAMELPWRGTVSETRRAGMSRHRLVAVDLLRQAARRAKATPAQLVMTATIGVLSRLAGSDAIRLGVPVANRQGPWHDTVGCIVSNQVITTEVVPATTGAQLLRSLREELAVVSATSFYPLDAQPERLGLPRSGRLVDVVFDHIAIPSGLIALRLLESSLTECPPEAKIPLTLTFLESETAELLMLFQPEYLSDAGAAEFGDQIVEALQALINAPDMACHTWPLETAAARRLGPALDRLAPPCDTLTLLPDRVMRAPPEAIAIHIGSVTHSYADLQHAARGYAGRLQQAAITPGAVIGVLGGAGFETIAAMLGTWLAGGVILSLDRRLPSGRLATMCDAGAPAVILRTDDGAPEDARLSVPLLEGHATGYTAKRTDPEAAAYVVFTSGTSKTPKAILGSHKGLAHFMDWQGSEFSVTADDRFVLLTNLAFDMALRDVWLPLSHGATLYIPDDKDVIDGRRMIPLIREWEISVLHLVPTLARSFLNGGAPAQLPFMRAVFFAGEPLTDNLVRRFRRGFQGDYRILNFYGPSETTQTKIYFEIGAEPVPGIQPIGLPLPQTRVTLRNRAGAVCAIGEPGEIVIETPFASKGYLNAPDDQARHFSARGVDQSVTVYRSGDRARQGLDGLIHYLGRSDKTVKVRGVSANPIEISDQIEGIEGVSQAAVATEPAEDGDHRLLAWYAGKPAPRALREALSRMLPSNLVPERILQLESLPVLSNGKIDSRALPRHPDIGPEDAQIGADALDGTASRILAHWRTVLNAPHAGLDTDFFASGGHSLAAIELVRRIQDDLGLEIGVDLVLLGGTPRDLLRALPHARPVSRPLSQVVHDPETAFDPFPMTRVQEAYWTGRHGFVDDGGVSAQTFRELRAAPQIDLVRLELAFDRLIARHPMLRTVATPDGRQRVLPQVPSFQIATQDLRGLPAAETEAAVTAWRNEMSHAMRQLEKWPLIEMRASLLEGETRLQFGLEAFICDAWSRVLLLEELRAIFDDLDCDLPPLGLQFRDYIIATDALDRNRDLEWWKARLDAIPPAPALPVWREKREGAAFYRLTTTLDAASWRRLQERASEAAVTPSAALLAAAGLVLGRWSGQDALAINVTAFDRKTVHPDVNRIIGDFTTTLAHSAFIEWSSFAQYARNDQLQLWQELAHSSVSGVDLARARARETGTLAATAYPVVFTSALTNSSLGRAFDWSWLGDLVDGISQTPQVWLDIQVYEHREKLHVNWDYLADLFQPGVIDAMFDAWGRLLDWLVHSDWDQPPPELVLPKAQRQIAAWSIGTVTPVTGTLVEGAVHHAERTPDAPAVLSAERSLSYAELLADAERIAAALIAEGVGPGDLVALVLPRGWREAVSVLGVMLAGAAYLPISTEQPPARIQAILDAAGPRGILRSGTSWSEGMRLEEIGPDRARKLPQPDDLAYVIFTSGSTGAPKGVVIRHRMAMATIQDIARRFNLGGADRSLALSQLSFDLSVWDLFGSWSVGAAVVYPEIRADPKCWIETIDTYDVRLWNSVPSVAQMLLDACAADGRLAVPTRLRTVLLSGDVLPVTLARGLERALPLAQRAALGGATEGAIWSICYSLASLPGDARAVPYGRALDNQEMHVLDASFRPCPLWVTGRIFIGGAGVAEGYWRDPERTAAQFAETPLGRLYDTGDLGRWGAHGQIEILGRLDGQLKVQGHRVELAEVKAALDTCASVKQSAVVVDQLVSGSQRLAAFVVTENLSAAKTHMADHLPGYMQPQIWKEVDSLPVTGNGKVDTGALRRLLEVPDRAAPEIGGDNVLHAAWCHILGAPPDGPSRNFFTAGGDSVSWIRLCAEVSRRGRFLPLEAIVADQSYAGIATHLHEAMLIKGTETAPATSMQTLYARFGVPRHFNQALLLRLERPVDAAHVRAALAYLVERHEALRLEISDGIQRFPKTAPEFALHDRMCLEALTEACRAFSPTTARLRACLAEDKLLLCADHLSIDAVSWQILTTDLENALDNLEDGVPLPMTPPRTAYSAYCTALNRHRDMSAGTCLQAFGPDMHIDTHWSEVNIWRAADALKASKEEFLTAAVIWAMGRETGTWAADIERNGRAFEGMDCSETVGWLTALVPVRVQAQAHVLDVLAAVKTAMREMPEHGVLSALRHAATGTLAPIALNYVGGLRETKTRRFAVLSDDDFAHALSDGFEMHERRLTVSERQGGLHLRLKQSPPNHGLMTRLAEALTALQTADPSDALGVSDFPDADISEGDLKILLGKGSV